MRLVILWAAILVMSTVIVALSGTIHWPMMGTMFAAMTVGLLIMVNVGKLADKHFVSFCSGLVGKARAEY
ncbi:hypothetical protein Sps_04528 [Shewanella psychrophila]|uniref:Uncharacterized protein n=2 Tax=Shewanella psychrophila TaxID=225848 RepID=A0A1S6HVN2_9GAMM|nr:hypothetical protein Sps_04528 [Shewanella psychrophila]